MAATEFCFIDDAAVTAGEARVPAASFDTGMNRGASNAPGIGISDDNPNLEEQLPNWRVGNCPYREGNGELIRDLHQCIWQTCHQS